jgi:hypothetical protein
MATSGSLSVPEVVRAWAPADALELLSEDGWILHTTDRWLYSSEPVARRRLLTLVRGLLPRVDAMPEGRALAVAREGDQWRLWLVTPSVRSLAEETLAAIEERSLTTVMACVGHAVTAARKLSTFGLAREAVPAGSSGMALADGRLVLLALDEGEEGSALEPRDPLTDMAALLDEVASEDARLRGWLDAEGSATIRRAQSETRGAS